MSQYLPVSDFKWVQPDITIILSNSDESDVGYIAEVDLEYPQQIHDQHNDYPLAPECMSVDEDWLSSYQCDLHVKLGCDFNGCNKLVPNLMSKIRYVTHYRNLKLYTQLAMGVTKIHRVLQCTQSVWKKSYIQLNTDLRKKASSEFEKDYFKLMNNSVFGKTMENLRKRINVNLVRPMYEQDKLRKLIADPGLVTRKIFHEDLVAIHRTKVSLTLNRPIYAGMAILDLSKTLMYDFYYNHLKTKYGDKVSLQYTDTDSLLLEIETPDIYTDMEETNEYYDMSESST